MAENERMTKRPSRPRFLPLLPLASGVTSLILGVGVLVAPAFAEKLPKIPDISKPISILQDQANKVPQPKENLPVIPIEKHQDNIPDQQKDLQNIEQREQKPQLKQPEEKPSPPPSVQNSEPIDQPSKPKLESSEKQSTSQPKQEPPQPQQSEQVQDLKPQPNPVPQIQDSQEQKSVPQPVPEAPHLKVLKKSANQPENPNPQSAPKEQDVVSEQSVTSVSAIKPASTPIKKPSPQVATNTELAVNTTVQNQAAEPVQKTKDGIQLPKTATPYPNLALSGVLFIFGGAMLDLYRRLRRENEA